MAQLRPFCAVRPSEELASKVAALPYDVVDRFEARRIGEANPLSFLHVDRAEMDLDPSVDIYAPQVYDRARKTLSKWEEQGILKMDSSPSYYIYELERMGKVQTGVVGCASIDDYLEDIVKKHELTREDKELDRIRHVDICDANTGPIYLAARYSQGQKEILKSWKAEHKALYDFVAEDGICHRVWAIDAPQVIEELKKGFDEMPCFYIADGHHRAASAVKVGLKRRQAHPDFDGTEEFNYFLSVVFPYDELTILGYHRVVQDLNGHTPQDFLTSLNACFQVEPLTQEVDWPEEKHVFGMYLEGSWYQLRVRDGVYDPGDVISQLDVEILEQKVLRPILGIGDPRTDQRIRFVGGSHTLKELSALADTTGGVAFACFPTSMEDLMRIADESKLMPPKSTWFEPKLRSGLFIHKLS